MNFGQHYSVNQGWSLANDEVEVSSLAIKPKIIFKVKQKQAKAQKKKRPLINLCAISVFRFSVILVLFYCYLVNSNIFVLSFLETRLQIYDCFIVTLLVQIYALLPPTPNLQYYTEWQHLSLLPAPPFTGSQFSNNTGFTDFSSGIGGEG